MKTIKVVLNRKGKYGCIVGGALEASFDNEPEAQLWLDWRFNARTHVMSQSSALQPRSIGNPTDLSESKK